MTSFAANDVQAAFARVLVDEWARSGVTDAVACPGSRSTPLLVALAEAAERGVLRLHVLLDERSAGFFALGLGLASPTGVPAVVVTTSGTAAAELHPAVLEAHHSGVPLLAVTADRPPELHDSGAPQTVRQVGLFGDAVRWETNPGVPELASAPAWRSLGSRSVLEARGGARRAGPVHVNLAFREPLLGSADGVLGTGPPAAPEPNGPEPNGPEPDGPEPDGPEPDGAEPDGAEPDGGALALALALIRDGRRSGAPWHRLRGPQDDAVPPEIVQLLAEAGERGVVVAGGESNAGGRGEGAATNAREAVLELAAATGWPVIASPLSNCRVPGAIGAADALLRSPIVREWRPDVVVRLGAPWASRVVNEWLAGLSCTQVLVDPWGLWAAPDHVPGEIVVASPAALCRGVAKAVREQAGGAASGSEWARRWSLAESAAQGAIDAAIARETDLTEPGIARTLLEAVPTGGTLVVASSMPIRDVEWWGRPRDGLAVVANRGVNGIDGVLSTALGFATSRNAGPVTALLGDLAFLYDIGALLGAARSGVDLDVVVVDNDGGGIFNFLPQAGAQPPARFERLWGTPHGADLVALARAYGVAAEEVTDLALLAGTIAEGGQGGGLRVFVAKTDRAGNVAVHRRLCAAVEAAVEAAITRLAGPT